MSRRFRSLAAACLLVSASPVHAVPLISPWITNPANGSQYALVQPLIPSDAMMSAIRYGGNLTTVRNAAENAWLMSTFGTYGGTQRLLMTGFSDSVVEGQWRWMSGEAVTYTNWAAGQPDSSNSAEDFAALYYPGHSQGSKWNDWAETAYDPIGLPITPVIERRPQDRVPTFILQTDQTWRCVAPTGNSSGLNISLVGTAWEASNAGWSSSTDYNDTTWTIPSMYGEGNVWASSGGSPVYFRKEFDLATVPGSMKLLVGIDDDVIVYINGNQVLYEDNGGSNGIGPLDVTQFLRTGTNLIAVKTQNMGGGAHLNAMLYSELPEPTTLALGVAGMMLFSRRRRTFASRV